MTSPAPALLEVRDLVKHFPVKRTSLLKPRAVVQAVNGVTFDVGRGRTLGVVGESGSGKSTIARLVMGLTAPTAGEVVFDGADLARMDRSGRRAMRRRMQMIFQDPRGSLDPRMRVADVIGEGLVVHRLVSGRELRARAAELLELVGLRAADLDKYAHEFSGGQAQRIAIARALATEPQLVVCDEAVSALDVSVQAQILNLLRRLQDELGLSYLFISHDLNVVRYMSDDVLVMYLGQAVEHGPRDAVFGSPQHPYTQALLSTVAEEDWAAASHTGTVLQGEIPSPVAPPPGCRFHTRCPVRIEICSTVEPADRHVASGHRAACHLVDAGVAAG